MQYNLGNCYQYGLGVEKDEAKAFEWYKKSAKQKHRINLDIFMRMI